MQISFTAFKLWWQHKYLHHTEYQDEKQTCKILKYYRNSAKYIDYITKDKSDLNSKAWVNSK